MFNERADFGVKKARYWHRVYGVTVEKDDIGNWKRMDEIRYVGEFTDSEWKKFIDESEKNAKGQPSIKGKRIDEDGNLFTEKKEKI